MDIGYRDDTISTSDKANCPKIKGIIIGNC